MPEKDSRSGLMMNASLLSAMLLTAIASAYLFSQKSAPVVNFAMVPIALLAMLATYRKNAKLGAIYALSLSAALALASLLFWPAQLKAFLFWIVWLPVMLFCVDRLRTGVNGVFAERDHYRAECARVAMTDPITQMRNLHAFLNDAPIYIRIAKRYNLTMVVLAVKLGNISNFRDRLEEVAYHEMLEAVSRAMRKCIRLEDLAYFIDDDTGVWCINMFTHLDSVNIVVDRLKKSLEPIVPDFGDGEKCEMVYSYGYAVYESEEDCTPINLLQRAIDMTEKD